MTKYKYLIATLHIHTMLVDEKEGGGARDGLTRAGLYQWYRAFRKFGNGGDLIHYDQIKDNLEDYDIVHINLCTNDSRIIEDAWNRLRTSSTKLIVNLDYKIEELQNYFPGAGELPGPDHFVKVVGLCDMFFVQEPYQAQVMRLVPSLDGRKIPIIPHPVDYDGLVPYRAKKEERNNYITIISHIYDNQITIPWLITSGKLRQKYQIQMLGHCAGIPPSRLFDCVQGVVDYPINLYELAHSAMVLDSYSMHSHGRANIECGVLGTPCVGRACVDAQNKIFPDITAPVENGISKDYMLREYLQKLDTDTEFYEAISKNAMERSKLYNWENKYNELTTALEEVVK